MNAMPAIPSVNTGSLNMLPQPAIEFEVARAGGLTVFDCRWNTPRRMGIGDKIVVCAAIQQIAAAGIRVAALWNPADEELFRLMSIPAPGGETIGSLIPWTDHVMAIPVGMTGPEVDRVDAACRHPIERALWGIGLDQYAGDTPDFLLKTGAKKKRTTLLWSPVEISRNYFRIEAAEWVAILEAELARNPDVQTIELYCAINDQPRAFDILRNLPVELAKRIHIRSALTLSAWVDACASARTVITAHNGCLWVAIGAGAAIHAVQREPHIPHHAMWAVKPGWGLGRLRVSTLPGMAPKAAPRIAQAGLSPCPP